MNINKERTGFGLSVHSPVSAEDLRERMNRAAESVNNIFVPSEITWEGSRYTFYVSHRQSLKDFIFENGFKSEDFFDLIRGIYSLFKEASGKGIDPYDFVFNYECIFVGPSPCDLEFIYAPDADVYKDGILAYNKCSDMAAIASLHIEYPARRQPGDDEMAVSDILRVLSEWEMSLKEGCAVFPYESIRNILDMHSGGTIKSMLTRLLRLVKPASEDIDGTGGKNKIHCLQEAYGQARREHKNGSKVYISLCPLVLFEISALCALFVWEYKYGRSHINIYLYFAWIVFMVCGGFLLAPKAGIAEKEAMIGICRKGVYIMKLKGDRMLRNVKYTAEEGSDEVRIGRDGKWADVLLGPLFVSRRHAELHRQDNNWYIKDLSSTNGTFVDGVKITPEQPVLIKNGSRIGFGLPESELIFRLP